MRPMQLWTLLQRTRRLYSETSLGAVFATVVDNFEIDITITGVDPRTLVDYLHLTYDLEGGSDDFEGGIIGPFQFSEIAWRDVGMTDWRNGAVDLGLSARAAVKFYFINRARFLRQYPGRAFTNEIAYLYHNQGPSGALYYLRNRQLKFAGQSVAANALFKEIGPL